MYWDIKLTTEEKITKARISIMNGYPFFAYLIGYVEIEEDKHNRVPLNCGMGVSPKGKLYYRKEYVDKLTDEELIGVLCHEVLHIGLLHFIRQLKRNKTKWNVATDIVINTILVTDGFSLPKDTLLPNDCNDFDMTKLGYDIIIKDVDAKLAEEVYEELPEIPENKYNGFDFHEIGDGDNGEKELTESERQELETEWLSKIQVAFVSAQQRGSLPKGLERYIDKLKEVEINWRVVLWKFVQQEIINDYTWNSRSKKSYALGIYLPNTTKEKIDVVISVDTSGSIEEDEFTKFLSEIIGMARAFRETISMRILFHDVEVQADYNIQNGNIQKILAMKPKGGGGTSHKLLFEKVKKEIKNCKCLISFTDGYSDLERIPMNEYKFDKLFIINSKGKIPNINGKVTFIKLKKE